MWCNQFKFLVFGIFFFLPHNFFLKLKRILTKVDISCTKWQRQTVSVLDPSTHLCRFDTNCGKIQYVSLVTLKTNRSSFCLILKLSHALDGLFSVYLGRMVININALFAEWSITECDVTAFRFCCLGFCLAWNPPRTFISIRITHNNTFWKCQKNWVFNISLIW